jgi:hypothetical protein
MTGVQKALTYSSADADDSLADADMPSKDADILLADVSLPEAGWRVAGGDNHRNRTTKSRLPPGVPAGSPERNDALCGASGSGSGFRRPCRDAPGMTAGLGGALRWFPLARFAGFAPPPATRRGASGTDPFAMDEPSWGNACNAQPGGGPSPRPSPRNGVWEVAGCSAGERGAALWPCGAVF